MQLPSEVWPGPWNPLAEALRGGPKWRMAILSSASLRVLFHNQWWRLQSISCSNILFWYGLCDLNINSGTDLKQDTDKVPHLHSVSDLLPGLETEPDLPHFIPLDAGEPTPYIHPNSPNLLPGWATCPSPVSLAFQTPAPWPRSQYQLQASLLKSRHPSSVYLPVTLPIHFQLLDRCRHPRGTVGTLPWLVTASRGLPPTPTPACSTQDPGPSSQDAVATIT